MSESFESWEKNIEGQESQIPETAKNDADWAPKTEQQGSFSDRFFGQEGGAAQDLRNVSEDMPEVLRREVEEQAEQVAESARNFEAEYEQKMEEVEQKLELLKRRAESDTVKRISEKSRRTINNTITIAGDSLRKLAEPYARYTRMTDSEKHTLDAQWVRDGFMKNLALHDEKLTTMLNALEGVPPRPKV